MIRFAFRGTAVAKAPIQTVWEVLTDHASYAAWSSADEAFLEQEGNPAPNGLGAVRVIRDKTSLEVPIDIVEEINHFWEPYLMGYRIIGGAPVKDHQGVVLLSEHDGGTQIRWHMTSNPAVDETIVDTVRGQIAAGVQRLVEDVAAESERRAKA